ncbi:MAG: 3-isopropylmalate dehydratase small subunit, partial [Woeseiaceae bacterium]
MTMDSAFRGIAAPLMRINIDTDAIIPSREMKRVSKTGLAQGLFANWRYLDPGTREPNQEFILNQEPFNQASILLAGSNFGCGSSREHAVWALKEWGIRAVIAPSFGSIFASNCVNNGVLPVQLDEHAVEAIAAAVTEDPRANQVAVDLEHRRIVLDDRAWDFDIGERERQMLLRGLSPIAMTLQSDDLISEFEADDA